MRLTGRQARTMALMTAMLIAVMAGGVAGQEPAPDSGRATADSDTDGRGDRAGEGLQDEARSRADVGGYGSFRLSANSGEGLKDSFTLRRFVVTTDARIGDRFQVYSEVEYERLTEIEVEQEARAAGSGLEFVQALESSPGSELSLEQAWGQWRLTRGFAVRFGAVLPPVGRFNRQHDDNLWNFPVRPLIDRAAQVLPASAAWTEVGLGVVGSAAVGERGELSYEVYVVNGVELGFSFERAVATEERDVRHVGVEAEVEPRRGAVDGSNTADAVAARLRFSPRLGSEVAISGYTGSYTPDYLDASGRITTVGLDGTQKLGSFYVEAEGLYTRYTNAGEVARSFALLASENAVEAVTAADQGTLETEVEVTLKNLAERRYGYWAALSRPIPLARGALGLDDALLVPTVRYERAWLTGLREELAFSGGRLEEGTSSVRQDRLLAGIALRPVAALVVQLFYQRDHGYAGDLIAPETQDRTNHAVVFGTAVGF